ncbi:fructose-1,6-bisphosphatase/inositol monophosphatase family enzyme [Actinophytocola algeriensis]|uniref:Fructose-1,6-bisphosphatase/inositol monophosphatase family enzyme n=1 Tax=Actinophytocola algeriensis TaxID=1768010 RepID=A0A7W7QF74_9PSEU|nr:hypothetical protein [Actinophytocola algeriensis]MBB4912490.1 fructose-1,6-bisphosphatase/inositol monophosphatase family enzyme [Actinophytocola algeriensis]MBE1480937.1 fructose-1,6-bisphosphatase/inositol monophosphatase family enzyme [Actinophytocola algeriensis]
MTDELLDLQRIAEQAVGLGYDIVKNTTPAEIRLKGVRDVVTDVDIAVQNEVRHFLKRMTPDVDFLGEEDVNSIALMTRPTCGHSIPSMAHPTSPTTFRSAPHLLL